MDALPSPKRGLIASCRTFAGFAVGAGVLIPNYDNALQLSNLVKTKLETFGRVLTTLTLVGALVGPSAST